MKMNSDQHGAMRAIVDPASPSLQKTTLRPRMNSLRRQLNRLRPATRHLLITILVLVASAFIVAVALFVATLQYIYFDRSDLPDIEAFVRFDCPAIGHIYGENGVLLAEFSKEHRRMIRYDEIPPIVRDAILAAEDKNFFSHGGVDYTRIPRVIQKVRFGTLLTRLFRIGRADEPESAVMLRQGGSTITQQLVRAYYLRDLTDNENSNQLRAGALSYVIGARSAKKLARKLQEIRLAVWVEEEFGDRFGSKQRAKEEILARYASFLYMGNGQYGFATAAEFYFGRSLATFTNADADKAALLAGIAKSPLYYAPDSVDSERVLHRRNQILRLMLARGFLSSESARIAESMPIRVATIHDGADASNISQAPAVVATVLDELKLRYSGLNADDLLQGRIQIYSTVDDRLQGIANEALEHGLLMYEKRHPRATGIIQGSVVVLKNGDASLLAEVGGRRIFNHRIGNYGDLNRATHSERQPGSAMKPIVYLAAFLQGAYTLETLVPDEPITVPDGNTPGGKAISNYDGRFKGLIPLRLALAESRNAVAIWITEQIGIGSILRTARDVGIQSQLQPYPTTSLGASEVTLLELANAYRTIASGTLRSPFSIRQISQGTAVVATAYDYRTVPDALDPVALSLVQEGLRGVVRLPTGTAHALDGAGLVPVMGKTGTTSQFRDALFVGSTYGPEGITVAVRIGFDDNRSLGEQETGGRAALPVFKEIMQKVYQKKLVGPAPPFPAEMEKSIDLYLAGNPAGKQKTVPLNSPEEASGHAEEGKEGCSAALKASPTVACLPPRNTAYPFNRSKNEHGQEVFTND